MGKSAAVSVQTTQGFIQPSSSLSKEPGPPVKTLTIAIALLSTLLPAAVALGQQTPSLAPPRPGFSFPNGGDYLPTSRSR